MPSDKSATVLESYTTSEIEKAAKIPRMPRESLFDGKVEYLPYDLGYIPEMLKEMAHRELGETEEKKTAAIKKFKQLIAAEKNFYVRTDDSCLLSYLRGKKYDVDRAFRSMQNTYKLRLKKRFYDAEDNTIVHDVLRQNFLGFLPYRAKNGSVIIVVKVGLWDPEKIDRDLLMWSLTHCMIHSIEDPATQIGGYTAIIDVRGVSNKHLRLLTIENILLLIHSTQNCFPGRYKAVHVIGMPKIFQYAYNIAYPFILSSKLRKRIFIHGEDLKSFHKHLPPCILPQEYEGALGPFDNSAWHADILTRNEWCLEQRLYGYMKSCTV